jgi:thioredoxin-related protein
MKQILIIALLFGAMALSAQEAPVKKAKIYNPEADAKAELKSAITEAKLLGKHVFVQIGGNWCGWCLKFHKLMEEDKELNMLFNSSFVAVKVNYSQEVKNADVLKEFNFPQRFGFPVFVILDGDGKQLHTQDSGLLEDGLGYDKRKLVQFFRSWSKAALDPDNYRNK